MNELQIFSRETQKVRTFNEDGVAWFVGKDICDLLGYANHKHAMDRHCKGVSKQAPLDGGPKRAPLLTPGGIQKMRVIDQADVIRLITHSKLPEAQAFEKWIFEEVIPTILRTGSYTLPGLDEMRGGSYIADGRQVFCYKGTIYESSAAMNEAMEWDYTTKCSKRPYHAGMTLGNLRKR
jgi:prophage antirepressor-like protein